jgi:HPt (histidine-containing phosphotransfer) domain-containing protein
MTGYLTRPFKGHELFGVIEGQPTRGAAASVPERPAARAPADLDALRTNLREVGAAAAANSLLDTFLQEAPECLRVLSGAIAGGQANQIAGAAHAFRGVVAMVRALELAELLERVEVAAERGDVAPAREGIDRLQDQAAAVMEYVRRDRERALAPQ